MSESAFTIHEFHEAAFDSLHALVRLQDLVIRYGQLSGDQRGNLSKEVMYQNYIDPLFQAQGKIAGKHESASFFSQMTAARLALGRDILSAAGMPAASAHELVFGVPLIFIRTWNGFAQPERVHPPPSNSATWQLTLYAPREEMNLSLFLDWAHEYFQRFNPLPLHVDLKLEYAKATAVLHASIDAIENCKLHTDEPLDEPEAIGANGPENKKNSLHPDGMEGGRWLWWKNKRYDVSQGVVYRMLDYMWDWDSASYDDLEDAQVFDSAVAPQTVRSYTNKANNALPSGFPWRLSTNSVCRQLTKTFTAKGAR